MSLADEMSADFLSIHQDLSDYISFGRKRVPALVNEGSLAAERELGGFSSTRSLSERVRRSDLSSTPAVGDLLYYEGVSFRIESMSVKKSTPFISLECLQQ